jgi:hypothetical protein
MNSSRYCCLRTLGEPRREKTSHRLVTSRREIVGSTFGENQIKLCYSEIRDNFFAENQVCWRSRAGANRRTRMRCTRTFKEEGNHQSTYTMPFPFDVAVNNIWMAGTFLWTNLVSFLLVAFAVHVSYLTVYSSNTDEPHSKKPETEGEHSFKKKHTKEEPDAAATATTSDFPPSVTQVGQEKSVAAHDPQHHDHEGDSLLTGTLLCGDQYELIQIQEIIQNESRDEARSNANVEESKEEDPALSKSPSSMPDLSVKVVEKNEGSVMAMHPKSKINNHFDYIRSSTAVVAHVPTKQQLQDAINKHNRTLTQRAIHKMKKRRKSFLDQIHGTLTSESLESDDDDSSTPASKGKRRSTKSELKAVDLHLLHPTLGEFRMCSGDALDGRGDPEETATTNHNDLQHKEELTLIEEVPGKTATIHVIVLVHGIKGFATDLSYLKSQLEKEARQRMLERRFYDEILRESTTTQPEGEEGIKEKEYENDDDDVSELSNPEGSDEPTGLSSFATHKETGNDFCLNHSLSEVSSRTLKKNRLEWLIVHAAVCNENLTDDGVANGGERLAREIYRVVKSEIDLVESSNPHVDNVATVTLSLVGNSLGGLYARYAAAKVMDFATQESAHLAQKRVLETDCHPQSTRRVSSRQENNDEHLNSMTIFGRRLKYNIFCTTASPHLGIADHTYIRVPRSVEVAGAYALFGDTGRDIFRLTDLVKQMATTPYYLNALAIFNTRIAFANAYSTDFAVPTETAAFLHRKSPSIHTFVDDALVSGDRAHALDQDKLDDVKFYTNTPLIVAALRTKGTYQVTAVSRRKKGTRTSSGTISESDDDDDSLDQSHGNGMPNEGPMGKEALQEETHDLIKMATSLDSLGWKKVFVDMSDVLPALLPTPKLPKLVGVDSILNKAAASLPSARLSMSLPYTSTHDSKHGRPRLEAEVVTSDALSLAVATISTVGAVAEQVLSLPTTLTSTLDSTVPPTKQSQSDPPSKRSTCRRLAELRRKHEVPSKDLADVLSAKDKIGLPLGHNMMVAHTKPKGSTAMNNVNQRGRPVMDSLAQELVESILD